MMRSMLKTMVAVLFLAAIAGLFVWRENCSVRKPIIHRTRAVRAELPELYPMPETLVRKGWTCIDFSKMPSLNITEAQSNEVANALAGVLESYASGQHATMKEKIATLPEYLPDIESFAFNRIMSPVWCKVRDFTEGKQPVNWNSVAGFSAYMEIGVALTRFACDLVSKRGIGSGAKHAEYMLLRQMQNLQKEFRQGGQVELEQKTQQYINDWIAHIESEEGYVRRYAWLQISLQYGHITEGSWSEGQLFRLARMQASGLVRRCHYRPKWLDEDFPLPEGVKDVWEREPEKP